MMLVNTSSCTHPGIVNIRADGTSFDLGTTALPFHNISGFELCTHRSEFQPFRRLWSSKCHCNLCSFNSTTGTITKDSYLVASANVITATGTCHINHLASYAAGI